MDTFIERSSTPPPLLAVRFAFPERRSPGEHICIRGGRAAHVPTLREKSQIVEVQYSVCQARHRRRSRCQGPPQAPLMVWTMHERQTCRAVQVGISSASSCAGREHSGQAGSSEKAGRCGALRPAGGSTEVMSMRCEVSPVPNAGQGAPSTVPARLPPRSSAQMIDSRVAEHPLARLDEPAGRVRVAEDARGGNSRLSGRPLARGGW